MAVSMSHLPSNQHDDHANDLTQQEINRRLLRKIAILESRTSSDDEQSVPDPNMARLKEPYTAAALVAVLAFLIYTAFSSTDGSSDYISNTKSALLAVCFFIIVLGMLTFPTSGPFSRPYPFIWRTVFSIGVLYEILLIIILFQTKSDARAFMKFLDPETGVPLAERSYGEHCEFTVENILPVLFDRFAVAHFVGWFLKAILFRDSMLCWVISIMWELVEICFTFMLPNFLECWWDQVLLDVLICNGLGILLGIWTVRKFEMMRYDWSGAYEYPTYTEQAKVLITKLGTPQDVGKLTQHRWGISRSIKRFFGIQFVVLLFQIPELNAFFLKTLLWVPPESYLNPIRLLLWFLVSLPSIRQVYLYMTNPNVKTIGRQSFLTIVMLATEVMIIFKFSDATEFPNPMPLHVKWLIAFLVLVYAIFVFYGIRRIYKNQPQSDIHRKLSSYLDNYNPDSPQPDLFPDFDGDIDENISRRKAKKESSRRSFAEQHQRQYNVNEDDDYDTAHTIVRRQKTLTVEEYDDDDVDGYDDNYHTSHHQPRSFSHVEYTATTTQYEDVATTASHHRRPVSSPAHSVASTSTSISFQTNVNPHHVRGRDLSRVRAIEDELEREQRRLRGVSLSKKQLARKPKRAAAGVASDDNSSDEQNEAPSKYSRAALTRQPVKQEDHGDDDEDEDEASGSQDDDEALQPTPAVVRSTTTRRSLQPQQSTTTTRRVTRSMGRK